MRFSPVKRALVSLAIGVFAIGTGEFVMLGLLPNVASDLSVSIPRAGHLISAYAFGMVVGAPALTALSVRAPRRVVLIALMTAFAVSNTLSALAPNYDLLLLAGSCPACRTAPSSGSDRSLPRIRYTPRAPAWRCRSCSLALRSPTSSVSR